MEYHTIWVNVLSNLLGIALVVWIHTKSLYIITFLTVAIYVVNMTCDVVGTVLFVNYRDGVVHSQVYAAIAVFLIFICELIVERIITIKENRETHHNFTLIIIPICSVLIVFILVYMNSCTEIGNIYHIKDRWTWII